jgi:hypothetical protein
VAAVLAGCGAVPHQVDDDASKKAISTIGAGNVVADYNAARAEAMTQSDAGLLQDVAADAALAIDGRQPSAATWSVPTTVIAGEFDAYPMWFVVVSDIPDEDVQVAAVFSRESSTEPWLLVQAPRLAPTTAIPDAETSDGVAKVAEGDATMPTGVSADELMTRYADKLTSPTSVYADEFADDSFVTQMRSYADAQPEGVGFQQSWQAAETSHVVELADGGALVFADLVRTETYDIEEGKSLRFDGSEASRFFSAPITDSATLTYYHQVLMLVPPEDKPRTIGQYGALVSATGS